MAARIDRLSAAPRPPGAKVLAGPERFYRIRVGDYRIVYRINDDTLSVLVISVGHRRDVYR